MELTEMNRYWVRLCISIDIILAPQTEYRYSLIEKKQKYNSVFSTVIFLQTGHDSYNIFLAYRYVGWWELVMMKACDDESSWLFLLVNTMQWKK